MSRVSPTATTNVNGRRAAIARRLRAVVGAGAAVLALVAPAPTAAHKGHQLPARGQVRVVISLRPNPVLAPRHVYEAKVARWTRQWPALTALPWPR